MENKADKIFVLLYANMKILKNLLVFLTYFIAVAIGLTLVYLSIKNLFSNGSFADSLNFATTPESEVLIRSALISIFTIFLPFNLIIRTFILVVRKLTKASNVSEFIHLFSAFFATLIVFIIAQPIIIADVQNSYLSSAGTFSQFSDFLRFASFMFIGSLILTILNLLIKFIRSFDN